MPLVKDRFHVKAGKDVFELNNGRLNHHVHMMLHVYKDRTEAPILAGVANDFVREKENRKQLFGKFSSNNILNNFSISSKSTKTENLRQE